MIRLIDTDFNKQYVIEKINSCDNLISLLHSVGIIEGEEIEKISKSPLGDPTIYKTQNTYIAIRKEDAKLIEVQMYE